jgi:phage shock protein PspC (stress-responsive transcriptional regulator)
MVGLVVTLVTFTVLVALAVALLVLVTVVPVFVALQMADVRRFSTGRWGAVSMAGVVVGLALTYELHKHSAARLLVVLPLLVTWATPGVLWLLSDEQTAVGGRAGLHE